MIPRFQTLLALMLCCALGGCARRDRPGVQPKHLLLITVESLRADHLRSFGYDRRAEDFSLIGVAPQNGLAWIAESGVSFSGALAASGDARAALGTIHTGTSPLTHGLLAAGRKLPADLTTLADDFSAAGFRCTAFVSAREPLAEIGLDRGFERFVQVDDDEQAVRAFVNELSLGDADDAPRFWWLHLSGPRQPWLPASASQDDLDRAALEAQFAALRDGTRMPTPAERETLIALYDDEVQRIDESIRRGIDALRRTDGGTDRLGQCAVVLVGSSGAELGERSGAWSDNGGLCEESLHVPLMIRHPGSITGRRILGGTVEHADIAPTLRELFALREPRGAERSLLAKTDSYRPREFAERPALALTGSADGSLSISARVDDDRLRLEYLGALELYDLARDPSQRHDLRDQLPDRVSELSAMVFDALFAVPVHSDWDTDGREFALRALHAAAPAPQD